MDYTIISFTSVSNDIINKYQNTNIQFINFIDDLYKLIDENKSKINEDLLKNNVFRYMKNTDEFDKILNIDNLFKEYLKDNNKIVIIHSIGAEFDEIHAMKFARMVGKDSINIFTIPFMFTGYKDIFNNYLEVLNTISNHIYSFDCNELRKRLSSSLTLNEALNYVNEIMFKIAYNINNEININNIIDEVLNDK